MSSLTPDPDTNAPPLETQAVDRGSVILSAVFFALGTLLSRILGLARDMALARYLGENARDAFINAFRLPNLFRRVLAAV